MQDFSYNITSAEDCDRVGHLLAKEASISGHEHIAGALETILGFTGKPFTLSYDNEAGDLVYSIFSERYGMGPRALGLTTGGWICDSLLMTASIIRTEVPAVIADLQQKS